MGRNESWDSSVSLVDFAKECHKSMIGSDKRVLRPQAYPLEYITPVQRVEIFNDEMRALRRAASVNKDSLIERVRSDFPDICKANLEAKVVRLHRESFRSSSPVLHRSRRFLHQPFISKTSPDRRYKIWQHTGDYWSGFWSCCGSESIDSHGCSFHVKNPDARCYLP